MANRTNSAATATGMTGAPSVADNDGETDLEPIRHETEDGTDYVVIPTTVQQEGVYRYNTGGSVSREYVDGEELTGDDVLDDWDGVPATLEHPVVVNEDGKAAYGLVRDPTARYTAVGEFRTDGRSTDTALKGELWLEESAVSRHNDLDEYVAEIGDGEYGEVSSGYAPGTITNDRGTYEGEHYEAEQKRLSPDHVAVLTDSEGNCSVVEGCGAGRTNEGSETAADAEGTLVRANAQPVTGERTNARSEARSPQYDDTRADDDWPAGGPALAAYIEAYYEQADSDVDPDEQPAQWPNLPQAARDWIAARSLLGDPVADTAREGISYPVVYPNGDLSEDALLSARRLAVHAPGEEATATIRETTSRLLEREFDHEFEDRQNSGEGVIDRARRAYRELHDLFGRGDQRDLDPLRVNGEDWPPDGSELWATDTDDPADGDQSGEVSADASTDEDDVDDVDTGDGPSTGAGSGDESTANEPAESGADQTDTTMPDDPTDRTQELVEEHGFDAENLPDEDEDCFDRIYEKFAGDDAGEQTEPVETTDPEDPETEDVETTTEPESPETPDGVDAEDGEVVKVNADELDEFIDDKVDERLESKETQQQREEQQRAIVNSDAPFDEGDLEPMNAEAVARVHEKFVEGDAGDEGQQPRQNYAGRPSPETTSRANADDGPDIPVGGVKNTEARVNNSGDGE